MVTIQSQPFAFGSKPSVAIFRFQSQAFSCNPSAAILLSLQLQPFNLKPSVASHQVKAFSHNFSVATLQRQTNPLLKPLNFNPSVATIHFKPSNLNSSVAALRLLPFAPSLKTSIQPLHLQTITPNSSAKSLQFRSSISGLQSQVFSPNSSASTLQPQAAFNSLSIYIFKIWCLK